MAHAFKWNCEIFLSIALNLIAATVQCYCMVCKYLYHIATPSRKKVMSW